jgi:hypothetical protein
MQSLGSNTRKQVMGNLHTQQQARHCTIASTCASTNGGVGGGGGREPYRKLILLPLAQHWPHHWPIRQ